MRPLSLFTSRVSFRMFAMFVRAFLPAMNPPSLTRRIGIGKAYPLLRLLNPGPRERVDAVFELRNRFCGFFHERSKLLVAFRDVIPVLWCLRLRVPQAELLEERLVPGEPKRCSSPVRNGRPDKADFDSKDKVGIQRGGGSALARARTGEDSQKKTGKDREEQCVGAWRG